MKKKILSLLLGCGIFTFVGSTGLTASAVTTEIEQSAAVLQTEKSKETYEDYEYSVLDDGTVEITKYNGSDKNVKIPNMIDGKKVKSIGKYALNSCSKFTVHNLSFF